MVGQSRKGEILEGAEDDIRATYYILAFQREFNDDEAELRWKVVDMMVVGGELLEHTCFKWRCSPSRCSNVYHIFSSQEALELRGVCRTAADHPPRGRSTRKSSLPLVFLRLCFSCVIRSSSLPVVLECYTRTMRQDSHPPESAQTEGGCCSAWDVARVVVVWCFP